jgi:hypothetical protein
VCRKLGFRMERDLTENVVRAEIDF